MPWTQRHPFLDDRRPDPRCLSPRTGCSSPSTAISTVKPGRSQPSTSGADDPQRRIREGDIPQALDTTQSRHSRRCADPSTNEPLVLSTSSANTEAETDEAHASTTGTLGLSAELEPRDPNRSKSSKRDRPKVASALLANRCGSRWRIIDNDDDRRLSWRRPVPSGSSTLLADVKRGV